MSRQKDPKGVEDAVINIKKFVETAEYCDDKYKFDHFQSLEESMFVDRGFVAAFCDLQTSSKNGLGPLEDIFEKILDREVTINITGDGIQVVFVGEGVKIAQNNARGVFASGEDQMILWPNKLKFFEVVINYEKKGNYFSIIDQFGEDVKSPALTKEQIAEVANQSNLIDPVLKVFQDDADIYRLRHLKYYGGLIEEYHDMIGEYPFENEAEIPVYVFVANSQRFFKMPIWHLKERET